MAETMFALDFSSWKRPYVHLAFSAKISFVDSLALVPVGASLVVWGRREIPDAQRYRLFRIEDGFLRSVGLGADLVRPMSWVVDDVGIYFDATRPSRLENLLRSTEFSEDLLTRAALLREMIVSSRLSKYNLSGRSWQKPRMDKPIVLVTGQVETDASLAFGAPGIRSNLGLLKAVRDARPEAYVVYKPHPDVVAGMRKVGVGEECAEQFCDEVVTDAPINDVLDVADEVHVMTSLTGFEALLRGKTVFCYGLPFYAGWGLTQDVLTCSRRNRQLSLDQLVAATLLLYPVYFDREGRAIVEAEVALHELLAWKEKNNGKTPWWLSVWRMILRRVVGVR